MPTEKTESVEAEGQRFVRADTTGRDRTRGGAGHDRVDVGVIPHVERAGGAGADGNAEDRDEADHRIDMARRQHQAGQAP